MLTRGCVRRASRGAYLQQLQLLAQHPEQAPSAAAADPSAMLASLLANNPGLLHAISTPPGLPMSRSGADIGVGHCASIGAAPDGAKKSMDGGSSDDTTIAGDPASFLQLGGPAASHPLLRPVPLGAGQRPNAATGPSISAPASGPGLMTSVFANSTLATRSMPQVGHFLTEPAGAPFERSRSNSDGLAGFKRSFSGDVKGGNGPVLPPKKRGEMAATLLGDLGAEEGDRGAQRSLSRLR